MVIIASVNRYYKPIESDFPAVCHFDTLTNVWDNKMVDFPAGFEVHLHTLIDGKVTYIASWEKEGNVSWEKDEFIRYFTQKLG